MRRKKISGISASNLTPAIPIAAGYIAANLANGLLAKVAVLNSPIAKAAVKLGLGLFLSGNKNQMIKGVGTGMVVNAVAGAVGNAVPSLGAGFAGGVYGLPASMEGLRMQSAYNKAGQSSSVVYE
jgi:hypothetical protein